MIRCLIFYNCIELPINPNMLIPNMIFYYKEQSNKLHTNLLVRNAIKFLNI